MFDLESHSGIGEGIYRQMAPNNPEYPKGAVWDALNMTYRRESEDPEKMRGATQIGSVALGGACTGLFDYDEGTRIVATAADGKIYERNAGNFSQATGGTGFDTTATTRWSGAMFYGASTAANLLILANGIDAPQKYDSSNGVQALGGSSPSTGKYPVSFVGRLWMADGSTLYYSVTNDAEDFAAGNGGGSVQVDRGSGEITGLSVFMGDLVIFKRDKIFRIMPTNNISEVSVRLVNGIIGCVSHHTIKEVGQSDIGGLCFMSDNGVQMLVPTNRTGGYAAYNISEGVKTILDRRSRTNMGTAWADFYEERREYTLHYGTSSSTPSEGVIANLARARKPVRWTRHNIPNLTAGTVVRQSGEEIQIVGDSNGNVLQMHQGDDWNGSGYTGRLFTACYNQGRIDSMKRYGRSFVDASAEGSYPVTVKLVIGRKSLPKASAGNVISLDNLGSEDGWGVGKWGQAFWGGSGLAGQWFRPEAVARGHYQRLLIETTGADQWFKVNGLSIESELTARQIAA